MKRIFTFLAACCLLMTTVNAQVFTHDEVLTSGTYSNVTWAQGITLTIDAGATVTFEGVSTNNGNLVVNGDLHITNTNLTIQGNLDVNGPGSLLIDDDLVFIGKVTVYDGGTLTTGGSLTFNNSQNSIDIKKGGVINVNGPTLNLSSEQSSYVSGTLNVAGTFVLSSNLVMDCPGAIYCDVMNVDNKLTNPVSGSGYIEVAGNFSSKNSFTASSAIVLNATVKGKNNAGDAIIGTASACTTLPVQLTGFAIVRSGQGIMISWETQTEVNVKGFLIQQSSDGIHFKDLAEVPSKSKGGVSSHPLPYSYQDASVMKGTRYYRILLLSTDGHTQLISDVKKLDLPLINRFAVYPNPARNYVMVAGKDAVTGYRLISLAGVVVKQSVKPEISVSSLPAGLYFVQAQVDGRWQVAGKFLKQ